MKTDIEDERQQLRKYILVDYRNASNSQDSSKYSALYHEDSIWCAPGIPDYIGMDSIKYGYDAKMANIDVTDIVIIDVEISGRLGYVIGGVTIDTFPFNGSQPKRYKHRVIWIFKNINNTWKIHRQIWNVKKTYDIH